MNYQGLFSQLLNEPQHLAEKYLDALPSYLQSHIVTPYNNTLSYDALKEYAENVFNQDS